MHIVELRIAGFKSFVDPVRLTIDGGLTGVVGPNGCGKSNLLEAVRWGMGATSAKAMRADDMDDVIFAGTNERPAREFAEVVLVIDGARSPEGEATRLEISRKIKREAGSTYRINGRESRAKDVQLLFADASTGANSPALVRQGQISELIAARPENRRRVLEEAAGVSGLHARRHEADLKLGQATANLERLSEVSAEIEAQRATLKRQARLAERYRGLAAEIRRLEAIVAARRWREALQSEATARDDARAAQRAVADAQTEASAASRALEETRTTLEPLREEELIATALLRRLEGERVGLERDLAEATAARDRAVERVKTLDAERRREAKLSDDAAQALVRLEAEREIAAQASHADARSGANAQAEAARAMRQAAEAALDAARANEAEARARHTAAQRALSDARARRAHARERRASAEVEAAASEKEDALTRRLVEAQSRAEDAHAAAARANVECADCEQAAADAEDIWRRAQADAARIDQRRAERAAEARALEKLAPHAASGASALAEIEVEPGYERAVAAALGDDIDAALDPTGAPYAWRGARARTLIWPSDLEPLGKHVRAPAALEARLAACALVSAADGDVYQAHLSPGARLVSIDGDLWRWDGLTRRASAPSPAAIRLEQKNRLAMLRTELTRDEQAAKSARSAAESARTARDARIAAREAARKAAPAALTQALRADAEVAALQAELDRLRTQREAAAQRAATLIVEDDAAQSALEAAEAAMVAAPAPAPAPIAEAAARTHAARARAAEAEATLRALDQAERQRETRLTAIAAEIAAWSARAGQAQERLAEIDAAQSAAQTAIDAAQAQPAIAQRALEAARAQAVAAEARGRRSRDDLALAERTLREAEGRARASETALAVARERISSAQARAEDAAVQVAALAARAGEALDARPTQLEAAAAQALSVPEGEAALSELEKKIGKFKIERDAGGPVNLRATEELEEVEVRLATIASERGDVEAAIGKLRQAIGKLNGEARRRLLAAHEVVNRHFADLFSTLFEGGQAELRLTDADDPLACGLDIFAQPPGKRLANLSLMSGGEQALTACALIFAVFLANPAPICVLDEVDAPLDDANVERFCRLLEAMKARTDTRFMVITHNPVTMARMDRLFGVTMPERGASQIVTVDLQHATQLVAAE